MSNDDLSPSRHDDVVDGKSQPVQPWIALYPEGVPTQITAPKRTLVEAWDRRVQADPDAPALIYFDSVFSARRTDEMADALAAALEDRGVARGDRVGIHLQNIPQYALIMLALWKLGATALVLNPMYMGRELHALVDDAEPVGIIATEHDVDRVRESVGDATRWVIGTGERDLQTRDDPRVFSPVARTKASGEQSKPADDGANLMGLICAWSGSRPCTAGSPSASDGGGEDLAILAYTSGTTGPPKGAMVSHANILAVTTSFARFAGIAPGDVVFALAPLFHITGAVVGGALALTERTALVFTGRFQADVVLDALREHRVTFMVGSITVYNAMMNSPHASAEHFASARMLYSGGAPIPPSTVEQFQRRFGRYIHNAYGMTETASGVIAVPPGTDAPVDRASGTLSIGVPLPGIHVEIVDRHDQPLLAGEQGELVLSGTQIVRGYWHNPAASQETMPDGRLHTGDGAIMDASGWIYLVDRLKDQINVSGYKVWPREVEDCLYEHPAVFEAAVVGVPDEYQGEAVCAYVSLKHRETAGEDELIAFVRDRLAPYKRPQTVQITANLPKTQTGKIRRQALRDN